MLVYVLSGILVVYFCCAFVSQEYNLYSYHVPRRAARFHDISPFLTSGTRVIQLTPDRRPQPRHHGGPAREKLLVLRERLRGPGPPGNPFGELGRVVVDASDLRHVTQTIEAGGCRCEAGWSSVLACGGNWGD